ncbi:Dothistromin biosynthesis peroxidase dotB [Hyphodiscus hymeniophilus]|uniref:Dothistromin biosynthesis peroxidase dotB n=1 Tax=Hyphodiscus hymeniophilus TaxID=353542 RepID=A0A9P7AWS2_9HELO|nr:Dothistromin biosynthesis peroxidase dotB [Hyphodiscus hymeniophilus]
MKYSVCLVALALCATEVVAFPSRMFDLSISQEEKRRIAGIAATIESEAKERRQLLPPTFDASKQYVSTTGKYAYVAPTSSDLRGPCPGLNAMANHGYIPHNGVATITQFIQGTYDVFGMGTDLATFLSVYGAVFDGDLTSWSIGGPPPSGLLGSLGLLGKPQGISGSHNKYESDVSPTRPDLYEYGNDYKVIISQFEEMYALPLGPNGYDLTALTPFRASRFEQSIANNPNFFNGPFSGVAVQPAAYTFIYRFMSNKSSEYPEGYLDGEVLKSFFGVTGSPGSFQWTEGTEKIPTNWYKRAIGDEYTIPFFATDLNLAALEYPQFLSIGGNTGTVNSFTGVDLTDLTGGVYNLQTLAEGNNALCFAFQFSQQAAPDLLKGLFSTITKPLSQLNSALATVLSELSCPQLASIDTSQFAKYPGSKGAY